MTSLLPATSSVVELRGIHKRFGGVHALRGVDLSVGAGSVLGIAGENGAGKSTLLKVMTGVHAPDSGEVLIEGQPYPALSPRSARQAGVAYVAQELSLQEDLCVADNLALGREPRRWSFVDSRRVFAQAEEALTTVGAQIDPDVMVRDLAFADRQLVEIAKAIIARPKVIVFDEPTSGLRQAEVSRLLDLITTLRDQGCSSVFITHRMDEFFAICDRIAVLRDGASVADHPVADLSPDELVSLMIGGRMGSYFPPRLPPADGAPSGQLLAVRDFRVVGTQVDNVTFTVECGEILGIAGLAGHGQVEVLEGLAGLMRVAGDVTVAGKAVDLRSPRTAMRAGITLVPEDRKRQGLILGMSVQRNLTLAVLRRVAPRGFISDATETSLVTQMMAALQVKPQNPQVPAGALSGGNQQKVVIGKALLAEPCIFLFADPTRGIDVKTKAEIYGLMRRLASEGKAVILVSTDLSEITSLCDRVLVMASGRVVDVLTGDDLTEHQVTKASFEAVEE